jgi:hypothetical protein
MGRGVRFTRFGGIFAAATVLAALTTIANADQPSPQSVFAPIPTPTYSSGPFALPYAAPKFDFGATENRKFLKEPRELSLDTIDLGKSALRLDVADTATRPAPDTPDLTNVIVPLPPGKKRGTRRYFGLTLTTATE